MRQPDRQAERDEREQVSEIPFYDELSDDYDRLVNWEQRLAVELPFIERQLKACGARRVLDAACGTGHHAIALARRGYEVVGTDLSAEMIARARANAAAAGVHARFLIAGFGTLARSLAGFDALLCLGNSLPHVLSDAELQATLKDFATVLRTDGLLLIQNRNFRRQRWLPLKVNREGEREWLFLRFYDWGEPLITFNVVMLRRDGDRWEQRVMSTRLRPLGRQELITFLTRAGFERVECLGDLRGNPFSSDSPNLVIVTRKTRRS